MTRTDHPIFATSSASTFSGSARRTPVSREHSRMLAGMLLAAVIAALLVVAEQVIDTSANGHLLAGWVALWTVAFAALALLAPPLRQVSSYFAAAYSRWARASALRHQEETIWEHARRDPRVMSELQAASMRALD